MKNSSTSLADVSTFRNGPNSGHGQELNSDFSPTEDALAVTLETSNELSSAHLEAPISSTPGADYSTTEEENQTADYRYDYTDSGAAERLVRLLRGKARYCKALGGFQIWGGQVWKRDETDWVLDQTKRVSLEVEAEAILIYRDSEGAKDDEEIRMLLENRAQKRYNHSKRCRALSARKAMKEGAAAERGIATAVDDWDKDRTLLNTPSGTVDLVTGLLLTHDPRNLITKITSVGPVPDAECPRFHGFLERVQPDPEIRAFLQRWAGYVLTGEIREHVLLIFAGLGRNGKGTFLEMLLAILKDYGWAMPVRTLMASKNEEHPTELAALKGRRLIVASEPSEGCHLDVAKVKYLTGGDTIVGRFMRQDYFNFQPTHKLVINTNHLPVITETTHAIWQRVLYVPWTVIIPQDEQIGEFGKVLAATEGPGILQWALEGHRQWREQGLNPPESVKFATRQYRDEQNNVSLFLKERCVTGDKLMIGTEDLYAAYRLYCSLQLQEPPLEKAQFRSAVAGMGFERGKSNGNSVYRGLRLAASAEADRPEPSGQYFSAEEICARETGYPRAA